MKKLRNVLDGNNKVVCGALNLPDYINHYATGSGAAVEVPGGARVMEVKLLADGVAWVRTGGSSVAAAAPSGVTDGTAPYAVTDTSILEIGPGDTHFAIQSSVAFTLAFWS